VGTLDDSNEFVQTYCEEHAEWCCTCGAFTWPDNLGTCLEVAGALAAFGRAQYTKGFSDSELLKAFCEDYVPEPYFPMGDTRPTAERLGWRT
jgi:hypothetical protein